MQEALLPPAWPHSPSHRPPPHRSPPLVRFAAVQKALLRERMEREERETRRRQREAQQVRVGEGGGKEERETRRRQRETQQVRVREGGEQGRSYIPPSPPPSRPALLRPFGSASRRTPECVTGVTTLCPHVPYRTFHIGPHLPTHGTDGCGRMLLTHALLVHL